MNEKKFKIIYIIGLIISTLLMLWIVFFGNISLNITFVIFFWVVKFLSGFGLILGISNGFLILLDKTKDRIGKRGTNAIIIFQIIIPVILVIYAIEKLITSYLSSGGISMTGVWRDIYVFFDNILYIYGILSLLLTLYIIPIIRDEIDKAVELGKLFWWKKKAKKVGRGIKKKYFRLKKEYAKAQIQDQMTVKEILDLWRNKFAVNLLLIIAIGTFIFTPITFICVMFWLRLYVFFRSDTNNYERIALLTSMTILGIIAVVSPYVQWGIHESILQYIWTMNIFYLIGIVIGSLMFIKKLLNLQGITSQALKLKAKDRKIRKLQKEKEDLKEKLKET